ncbi:hypothetical protein PG984_007097 [Apiospora sp. TS-2023a]
MKFTAAIALQIIAFASAATLPVEAGLEMRAPKVEVDVQQSNYCLPSNLNCPYKKREPLQPARVVSTQAEVTDVYYNNPNGKREPSSNAEASDSIHDHEFHDKREPEPLKKAHSQATQVSIKKPQNGKREPEPKVEVDVQQSNYCLPSNLNCPYKKREPLQEAHADVTQVSYGPICHLHCRRALAALSDFAKRFQRN